MAHEEEKERRCSVTLEEFTHIISRKAERFPDAPVIDGEGNPIIGASTIVESDGQIKIMLKQKSYKWDKL